MPISDPLRGVTAIEPQAKKLHNLEEQLEWLADNQICKRYIDLIEVGETKRIYGISYCTHVSGKVRLRDDREVFVKRVFHSAHKTIHPMEISGISFSSYITLDEFFEIQNFIKSDVSLPGISTYESAMHAMNRMLQAWFENNPDGSIKLPKAVNDNFHKLYRGVKYFQEMFIIPSKPSWWVTTNTSNGRIATPQST